MTLLKIHGVGMILFWGLVIGDAQDSVKSNVPCIPVTIDAATVTILNYYEGLIDTKADLDSKSGLKYSIHSLESESQTASEIKYYKIVFDSIFGYSLMTSDSVDIQITVTDWALEINDVSKIPPKNNGQQISPSETYDTLSLVISLSGPGKHSRGLKQEFDEIRLVSTKDSKVLSYQVSEISGGEIKIYKAKGHETLHKKVPVSSGSEHDSTHLHATDLTELSDHGHLTDQVNLQLENLQGPSIIAFNPKDTCISQLFESMDKEILYENGDFIALLTFSKNGFKERKNEFPLLSGTELDKLYLDLEDRAKERIRYLIKMEICPLFEKPALELRDTLNLKNGNLTYPKSIYLGAKDLKEMYFDQYSLFVRELLAVGDLRKAIDTLEFARKECSSYGLDTSPLQPLVKNIFLEYIQKVALEEASMRFGHLLGFKNYWGGKAVSEYESKMRSAYNDPFSKFSESESPVNAEGLLKFFKEWEKAVSEKDLNSEQKGALEVARFILQKNNDPELACSCLSKARSTSYHVKNQYNDYCTKWKISKVRTSIIVAFNKSPGDYQTVYKLCSENPSLVSNDPSIRLMYAEAAENTGNFRDAYKQYQWFDSHWNQMPGNGLEYNDFLSIMRYLAYRTGDFKTSFQLFEKNFINTNNQADLAMATNSYRSQFFDLISSVFAETTRITGSVHHLPNYERYKPFYILKIEVGDMSHVKERYPFPLISLPLSWYSESSRTAYSLENIGNSSFLEISHDPALFEERAKPLADRLSTYNGEIFKQLMILEKETGLEFLGMALKSLFGEIYTFNADSFHSELQKLVRTGAIKYAECGIAGESERKFGTMPAANDYEDQSYLGKYRTIINYENTTLTFNNSQTEEIAIPLKKSGKRIGYLRFGIIL